MQPSDEHPSISDRPSLLSRDQQAEADRHRILSGLENNPEEGAGGASGRKGWLAWLVTGAAVLALGACAGLWLDSADDKVIVLAAAAPLPAKPAPAVALATDIPVVRGMADDVAAAAILYDAPRTEPDMQHGPDELANMLEPVPAPAAAATPAKAPAAKPAKPAPAVRAAKAARPLAKAPVRKTVAAARQEAKNGAPKPRAAAPGKKKVVAKPAAPVDNDVALLAAVVAHAKTTAPRGAGAAARLRECKSLGTAAEAKQCRARVCAGAKGEPECKSAGPAKVRQQA